MLDFRLATADEIGEELGQRLKKARQAQGLQQVELALRAGISRNTLLALESHGKASMNTLIRVAIALGQPEHLQSVFVVQQVKSIAELEELSKTRKRIRKPVKKE